MITEEQAWRVYNFINDWKSGKYGEIGLQQALNENFNDDRKVCCICGKEFSGWGNNPWPIQDNGVCCDECNKTIVIKERIKKALTKKAL